jgi:hypothetical protein
MTIKKRKLTNKRSSKKRLAQVSAEMTKPRITASARAAGNLAAASPHKTIAEAVGV